MNNTICLLMKWILFVPLLGNLLYAEENEFQNALTPSVSFSHDFTNMLVTLLFLLLVIFFSLLFLKKIMRGKMRHSKSGKGIKVLQRKAITPKSSLYLLDICGKGIVIAESPQGIHLIVEFPEGTDLEALLEKESLDNPSFTELMQKKLSGTFSRK